MPPNTNRTYDSLLKYLAQGATNETQLVTAIYFWMRLQDYASPSLDPEKADDTPRGYMKRIKEDKGDRTDFFTILCRRAGIPCRIISGIGKDDDYSIGGPERDMTTRWCAVFADDEWRLVHVEWALRWSRDPNQNVTQSRIWEFYFFTDPDEFSTICLPDDFRWQLLNQAYSRKEFLNLPHFRPPFFQLDSTLLSPKAGSVVTHNGRQDVELGFPKHRMETIQLGFKLDYKQPTNKETQEGSTFPSNLKKYVFVNKKPSRFLFELVFPVPGRYLFDVYVVMDDDEKTTTGSTNESEAVHRLCQIRIHSDREFTEETLPEPLPDTPAVGWGPGPACRRLGLVPLSDFEGVIYIKPGERRDIRFRMLRNIDVQSQLMHNYLPIYELVEQVESIVTEDELCLRTQIPEEGQYALKVFSREAGSKEFHLACVYLLRQRERTRLPEKHRDKMLRTRLQHHISSNTSQRELEDALEMFTCYNVPDQGERKRAALKLKHYWDVKRELHVAVKGRNVRVLGRALERAHQSMFEAELQEDIHRTAAMLESLEKRKGYMHPIARMDPQTMLEIRNFTRPPRIVHDVMMSTYLLLGEQREDVQDWEQIQWLMGRQGAMSLQKRILCRRPEDVTLVLAEDASAVMDHYSLEKTREVANGISAFYKWNKQFIREVQRKEMSEKEMQENSQELTQELSDHDTYKDADTTIPGSRATNDWKPIVVVGRGPSPGSKAHIVKPEMESNAENKDSEQTVTITTDLTEPNDEQNSHPFGVNSDTSKVPEIAQKKFIFSAMKPKVSPSPSPVSYAGWKPENIGT
ncbi:hillarin-like [Dreissena polymorpha]|uniref:hillarin-like n=1 Tax=Dreissena polymorpha TaxID=45954 RepID=UPI002264AC46|nr:hillarin-like [Dreissena polymorpha]